ncbi:PilZ domain-containing protein [Hyphomonas sp.]|uniref:PilZ domain-containing protein n=1 Tax=Hyphomonas sp. TaxID=87 RepID=UPI00391D514E
MSNPEVPRHFPRQRALKAARMICDGASTYDVTIRDISDGGAKVKLASPFVVPERFTLVILNPNTGVPERKACEKRWQRGDQVGAQFLVTSTPTDSPPPATASLRRKPIGA